MLEVKTKVFGFDYQKMNMSEFVRCLKNNVRLLCSICNLVNLVKALSGSVLDVSSFIVKD